ncbi:Transmembrane protein [Quillaja saponaria]|uniref:Transmembrane protein n=1 Tax=Quillaja saponaria TaxID=32244 RepID=A0AAD7P6Y4_QUISA|nr:Transmembrane protein [Quillaja saponaria]
MAQNLLFISFTSIFFVFIFQSQNLLLISFTSNHIHNQLYQKETRNMRNHGGDIITNVFPPAPPTHQVVGGASPRPPSPSHGINDFRPTAPGHSPGDWRSTQN